MLLILWVYLFFSDIQADLASVGQTIDPGGKKGLSVSLSNLVVMSAMTSAAVKRCLELDPGLVFQLVESTVNALFHLVFKYKMSITYTF